jgi:pyruvate,water dikinase
MQQVNEAIAQLESEAGARLYAIRASRVVDDVPNPAASGLQQAYLAVPRVKVMEHVVKCWGIPWTSRAIYYRNRKKIDQTHLAIAVVVQPMIAADAAGVMFTANPLNGAAGEIHIDSIWGLGSTVVQAKCRPDHFVVEKVNRAIVDRAIAEKDVMDTVAAGGGLQSVGLAPEKRLAACLSDDQVSTLAALGLEVEKLFATPQDIEWCVAGGKAYLLQARELIR